MNLSFELLTILSINSIFVLAFIYQEKFNEGLQD